MNNKKLIALLSVSLLTLSTGVSAMEFNTEKLVNTKNIVNNVPGMKDGNIPGMSDWEIPWMEVLGDMDMSDFTSGDFWKEMEKFGNSFGEEMWKTWEDLWKMGQEMWESMWKMWEEIGKTWNLDDLDKRLEENLNKTMAKMDKKLEDLDKKLEKQMLKIDEMTNNLIEKYGKKIEDFNLDWIWVMIEEKVFKLNENLDKKVEDLVTQYTWETTALQDSLMKRIEKYADMDSLSDLDLKKVEALKTALNDTK